MQYPLSDTFSDAHTSAPHPRCAPITAVGTTRTNLQRAMRVSARSPRVCSRIYMYCHCPRAERPCSRRFVLPITSLLLIVMSVRASLKKRHQIVEECTCECLEGGG